VKRGKETQLVFEHGQMLNRVADMVLRGPGTVRGVQTSRIFDVVVDLLQRNGSFMKVILALGSKIDLDRNPGGLFDGPVDDVDTTGTVHSNDGRILCSWLLVNSS
jgi:hypothetical protein